MLPYINIHKPEMVGRQIFSVATVNISYCKSMKNVIVKFLEEKISKLLDILPGSIIRIKDGSVHSPAKCFDDPAMPS